MTEQPKDKDVEENKLMAAIGYVICFIPLFMAKESKFAQFHAKQGLILFIAWVAVAVFSAVPILGWILSPILSIVLAVISILGIVMAIQGKWYRMPVVADLADKIKI